MATTQKRGDGYRITVSCGYDLTGKQIRRHDHMEARTGHDCAADRKGACTAGRLV